MHDANIDLLPRVRRLEMLLGVALFFGLASSAGLGFCVWKQLQPHLSVKGTITAQAVELRSHEGKVLARFNALGQAASLEMRGREGKVQVHLTSTGPGGSLELSRPDGGKLARLGPGRSPGAALHLLSDSGKQIAYLGGEDDGDGNMTLSSKDGDVRVALRDNDGHGGGIALFQANAQLLGFMGGGLQDAGVIQLNDAKGRQHALLTTNQHDESFLLLGRETDGRIELGMTEGSVPSVSLHSPGSKGYVSLVSDTTGGWWSLGDPEGRMRVHAGPTKDGFANIKLYGANEHRVAVMTDTGTGGYFQTLSRSHNPTFSAGCDDREGAGYISVSHHDGQQVFVAGMSRDYTGGIINVRDLTGKMILRAP